VNYIERRGRRTLIAMGALLVIALIWVALGRL
jgi:type II secretory pathway component PulM